MASPSKENLTIEVREEEMISPLNGHTSRRTAHFLRPSVTSIDATVHNPPLDSLNPRIAKNSLRFRSENFVGWRPPQKSWKTWVNRMQSLHNSTWKQAAIDEAIINSTFEIHRNADLILGLAEMWCSETNTFVFPWGEATITLEDMMFLGCYPILGDSVQSPSCDSRVDSAVDELNQARSDIIRGKSKKATQTEWMTKFIDSGDKLEHEAFLSQWLSRFVFPVFNSCIIGQTVLPIAARLARGTKIALGPAVLASIYKNLSSLKRAIVDSRKLGNDAIEVKIAAPFQLVQAWVWERFPKLHPKPHTIELGDPMLARWHGLKKLGFAHEDVLSGKYFIWRPYTTTNGDSLACVANKESDYSVLVDSCLDEAVEGFVRCVRSSELVGFEKDCIEQYLPHRVARQFGMDQDLPGHIARVNGSSKIAWRNYTREIGDTILDIPSRVFESSVTARYSKWWDGLRFATNGTSKDADFVGKNLAKGSKRDKPLKKKSRLSISHDTTNDGFHKRKENKSLSGKDILVPPPPGFSHKRTWVEAKDLDVKDKETRGELAVSESDENSVPHDGVVETEFKNEPKAQLRASGNFGSLEELGENLEKRVCVIEKLCASLEARNCSLGDAKFCKQST